MVGNPVKACTTCITLVLMCQYDRLGLHAELDMSCWMEVACTTFAR